MSAKKPGPKKASAPNLDQPPNRSSAPPPSAKVIDQEYALVNPQELRLHPKNPKKGNVAAIGESIAENGFYGAIYAQKSSGLILAGNHRWKSAVEKGLSKVPVIWLDVDDAKAESILLGDNRIADLGTYDDRAVLALLEEQRKRPGGLAGTGYQNTDLQRLQAKYSAPEKFPEFVDRPKLHYKCPKCAHEWS